MQLFYFYQYIVITLISNQEKMLFESGVNHQFQKKV